jgi:hypothetical protein
MENRHAWHHHRQALILVALVSLHPYDRASAELPDITKSIVNHVQTSLARAPYNIDDFGAYQAAALSVRDNLIVSDDLLDCLKIQSRLPHTPTRDSRRLLFAVHILFPFPRSGS